MADIDLEQFLDNAGVPQAETIKAPIPEVVFDPIAKKITWQESDNKSKPSISADNQKCFNEALFKPGDLMKTKTTFPLGFKCKSDGSLWESSEDFNKSCFFVDVNITFVLVEEGIVNVGKIVPEAGWCQSTQHEWNNTRYEDSAFEELRFVKCLAFLNEAQAQRMDQTKGTNMFYILFDRNTGRLYAKKYLFDVLAEASASEPELKFVDYSSVLTLDRDVT